MFSVIYIWKANLQQQQQQQYYYYYYYYFLVVVKGVGLLSTLVGT